MLARTKRNKKEAPNPGEGSKLNQRLLLILNLHEKGKANKTYSERNIYYISAAHWYNITNMNIREKSLTTIPCWDLVYCHFFFLLNDLLFKSNANLRILFYSQIFSKTLTYRASKYFFFRTFTRKKCQGKPQNSEIPSMNTPRSSCF